jgi:predicted enzyme related to lactoylglutathione lyase
MADSLQPPNTPIWVDLSSEDIEKAKTFYGGLLGWEAETVAPPEAGSYTMFRLDGKMVAAVMTTMGGMRPPVWMTYIHSVDADETAGKVRDAGGTMMFGPEDVFEDGRTATLADPGGAVVGLWQPRRHPGAEVVGQPGSFGWAELSTRDLEGAKRFYADVFGWGSETSGVGPAAYTEWKLDGQSIAGAMEMGPEREGVPPHWLIYFSVADVDASAARAQELGATVVASAMDFPGGRFAVVSDLDGATFGLMRLNE